MTCTEGREPSGLAMVSLSRVLGDVRRYLAQYVRCSPRRKPRRDSVSRH